MLPEELHNDMFLRVLWEGNSRIVGLEWKDATSSMSTDEFKAELTLFAGYVENKKARGILVDIRHFSHKMEPGVQEWRVKHISTRYNLAGVQRFAFLLSSGSQIPPMMNQSTPGEKFATRAFTNLGQAREWLTEAEQQQSAAS